MPTSHDALSARLLAAQEVQQCYDVAGEWDYVVVLVANDMSHCRELIARLFLDDSSVKRCETLPVFDLSSSVSVSRRRARPAAKRSALARLPALPAGRALLTRASLVGDRWPSARAGRPSFSVPHGLPSSPSSASARCYSWLQPRRGRGGRFDSG